MQSGLTLAEIVRTGRWIYEAHELSVRGIITFYR